ncbi:unnamed protein product [Arabis nemorensis]|uniref:Uncharacterized protein n=1 Tax=Arabis nemorensis TaxID=586526 RepID=A0A565CDX9_9BRAS|nr:unnamed protein product [Arabis nemorensis]
MGNCLMGGNNVERVIQEEEVVKKDYKRKDRKVKIVLRRDELEKLILFQLNVEGKGETTLASFGDFLKELEAERSAGEAAAKAAEEEEESRRRCRKWRPSLERIIEWPEV